MDDDEALARRLQKEEAAFAARRDAEDASSLQQFLKTANVVSCPHGCGTLIERPTACAVPELTADRAEEAGEVVLLRPSWWPAGVH